MVRPVFHSVLFFVFFAVFAAQEIRACSFRDFLKQTFFKTETPLAIEAAPAMHFAPNSVLDLADKRGVAPHFIQNGSLEQQTRHFKERFPNLDYRDFLSPDLKVRKKVILDLNSALFTEAQAKMRPLTLKDVEFLKTFESQLPQTYHHLKRFELTRSYSATRNTLSPERVAQVEKLAAELSDALKANDLSKIKVLDFDDGGKLLTNGDGFFLDFHLRDQTRTVEGYHPTHLAIDSRIHHLRPDLESGFAQSGYCLPWFDELAITDFTRHSKGTDFMPIGILNLNQTAFADGIRMNAFQFYQHDLLHAMTTSIGIKLDPGLQKSFAHAIAGQTPGFADAFDRILFATVHENPRFLLRQKNGLSIKWDRVKEEIISRSVKGDFGPPLVSAEAFSRDLDEALKRYEKILKQHQIIQ